MKTGNSNSFMTAFIKKSRVAASMKLYCSEVKGIQDDCSFFLIFPENSTLKFVTFRFTYGPRKTDVFFYRFWKINQVVFC